MESTSQPEASRPSWTDLSWFPLADLTPGFAALEVYPRDDSICTIVSRVASSFVCAVPTRAGAAALVESTRRFANVEVVACNARSLPFAPQVFDLIVANGLMDETAPTASQVRLTEILPILGSLLRPDGVLVLGAANAISHRRLLHASIPGADEAGHATLVGLRRSLNRSGLGCFECYEAEPAHWRPYLLTSMANSVAVEMFLQRRAEPSVARRRRLDAVKRFVARSGLFAHLAPQWVILAKRTASGASPFVGAWQGLADACPALPTIKRPAVALSTHRGSEKTVLRVFDQATRRLACVVKISGDAGQAGVVARERDTMRRVHGALSAAEEHRIRVPAVLGDCVRHGRLHVFEEAFDGVTAARLVFSHRPGQWLRLLRRWLPAYVDCTTRVARTLEVVEGIGSGSGTAAGMLAGDETENALSSIVAGSGSTAPGWARVQHGDFTIENIIHVAGAGDERFGVIDWEHCGSGFPPLYDVYSLLVSCLPAIDGFEPGDRDGWARAFQSAFFEANRWSELFHRCLQRAADGQSVSRQELWPLFCAFLVTRRRHFSGRGLEATHADFIRLAAHREKYFLTCTTTPSTLARR